MNRPLEPERQFSFISPTGRTYTRSCYWDGLYVFTYRRERILVADRVVPHTNLHEALYDAFRGHQGDTLSHRLLPEALEKPLLGLAREGQPTQPFVESIVALIPTHHQSLDEEYLKKTETQLEEIASKTLMERGITGGLGSFAANDANSFLSDHSSSDEFLGAASGDDREDDLLLSLSVQVDAAIKEHTRHVIKDDVPVRHGAINFDLSARLYTKPRYLAYIRRLLKARGSYASPIVRDFLAFYSRCLNIKLNDYARETQTEPGTLKKRLESTLGREKSGSHHAFDYHRLIILGFVVKG
jgi:hypothetical protein